LVQKSNEENSSISNDYDEDFENEEGIHRSSETGIEDEANEEEKDLKSFSFHECKCSLVDCIPKGNKITLSNN